MDDFKTLDEWKAAVEATGRTVYFSGPSEAGVVYANWRAGNPNIDPTLGLYFTKPLHGKPAGFNWYHE